LRSVSNRGLIRVTRTRLDLVNLRQIAYTNEITNLDFVEVLEQLPVRSAYLTLIC